MDDDVMRALNVLKRNDKLDSILFWTFNGGRILFLPDISYLDIKQYDDERYEIVLYYTSKANSSLFDSEKSANKFIKQWKMAKMAATFL